MKFRPRSVDRAVHHFSFSLVKTNLGRCDDLHVDLCRAVNRYRCASNDAISKICPEICPDFSIKKAKISIENMFKPSKIIYFY